MFQGRYYTPVTSFIRHWGFEPLEDLRSFPAQWKGADHKTARYIKAHQAEITHALERHGWFDARDREHKTDARVKEAYQDLMAVRVTCPDDMLLDCL